MARFRFIHLVHEDKTAWISLNHPPVNALSREVLKELEETFEELNNDAGTRAVVISSAIGKFFCAGADVRELAQLQSGILAKEYSENGQRVFQLVHTASKPYIAAVEGYCLGGGLELMLACHLRIAGSEARLGFPEIRLGIVPGFGGTQRLPEEVGTAQALEMILTGKEISAAEAHAMGLINQVVKAGSAVEQALNLARQIQSQGAQAVAALLQAIRGPGNPVLERGLALEAELFGKLFETEDAQEGIHAFLEKRVPEFKNR